MDIKKKIKIGNQSSFFAPSYPFEYALLNHFNAFEFFPDKKESGEGWDLNDMSYEVRDSIRDKARKNDVTLSVHVPWYATPFKPDFNEIFTEQIEFARNIGAALIVIHYDNGKSPEDFINACSLALRIAVNKGIKLAIENTPFSSPDDFNHLFSLIKVRKDIQKESIGMCLDIGHANLCSATQNDYLGFIDKLSFGVPIIHCHMHENYGDFDSHLPLFTGPSSRDSSGIKGVVDRLVKRSFSGAIIFEQWPNPPTVLNQAREKLYEFVENIYTEQHNNNNVETGLRPVSTGVSSGVFAPVYANTKKTNDIKNTSGLLLQILDIERKPRSWREKLNALVEIINDPQFRPSSENFAYLAIYVRFLATGEIKCVEDSGHYRPNHHAKAANDIEKRLTCLATPSNIFIIRKIYPWLPSYHDSFTRKEPLTRIRDIAHRNDIPKGLKDEIKRTLQNKLHRSADPGDLITSESILKRITENKSEFSSGFVEEFKIFHQELKEFFNAHSLDETLGVIMRSGMNQFVLLIQKFLISKKNEKPDEKNLVKTFQLLTELRKEFLPLHKRKSSSSAQLLRLADIRLEDYAFVILSSLISRLESQKNNEINWSSVIDALNLILSNFCITGIETEESEAILSDLTALCVYFDANNRDNLLHLKSALERFLRLSHQLSSNVLSLFSERVRKLGNELGVREHVIRYFVEGDIRASLIFHASTLCTYLLKTIRHLTAQTSWDVAVSGCVSGRLVCKNFLGENNDISTENRILLLDDVEGDEEIPTGVTGIIIGQSLPHLSHLGIRARQDKVVFAICEDMEEFTGLKELDGKKIILTAEHERVKIEVISEKKVDLTISPKKPVIKIPIADLSTKTRVIHLPEVTLNKAGGKAYGAKRLEELSSECKGDNIFLTPSSMVLPFSAMHESLGLKGDLMKEIDTLRNKLEKKSVGDISNTLNQLREKVAHVPVHREILLAIQKKFDKKSRLVVRSSSNFEDLDNWSGAGLHKSFININPSDSGKAISEVWASLWTTLSFKSRRKSGVKERDVYMGVLVQEMVFSDISFVMHTLNPLNKNPDELYVEITVGMGDALTSGATKGVPYRMIINKKSGKVEMMAFSNISYALLPAMETGLKRVKLNYSKLPLTSDAAYRKTLGDRLLKIGTFIERSFGTPQDIEGAVSGDNIYIVQSRPQIISD